MKRDFLTVWDLSSGEIRLNHHEGPGTQDPGRTPNRCPLIGKSIGLLFEKASTRTRVSFEAGIYQLGAQAIYHEPFGNSRWEGVKPSETPRGPFRGT